MQPKNIFFFQKIFFPYILAISLFIIFLSTSINNTPAFAKILDIEPVIENNISYDCHGNCIEATQISPFKPLWKINLYYSIEPLLYIPFIEKDIQWNIIKSLSIAGNHLIAIDSNGNSYKINKLTGIIISENINYSRYINFYFLFLPFIILLALIINKLRKRNNL